MPRNGNITGETFDPQVIEQIEARQKFLGARIRNDQHILYSNNNNSFLRLASSINIESNDEGKNQLKKRGINENLIGDKLAKSCVLFGGTVGIDDAFNPTLKYGIVDNNGTNFDPISTTAAYGWGGISSRGFVPMPSIESADISFINRGALAKANVKIKVYSVEQLQIFDVLYFRIGYSMLLEWGHNYILSNNLENNTNPITPRIDFVTTPLKPFFEGKTQEDILKAIKDQRKNDKYNYDAMLGKVTNFTWKFNADGSYDIDLNLLGYGDIIESLKINTLPSLKDSNSSPTLEQKAKNANANLENARTNLDKAKKEQEEVFRAELEKANKAFDGYKAKGLYPSVTDNPTRGLSVPTSAANGIDNKESLNDFLKQLNALASKPTVLITALNNVRKANDLLTKAYANVEKQEKTADNLNRQSEIERKRQELAPTTSILTKNSSKLNLQLFEWRNKALSSSTEKDFFKLILKSSSTEVLSNNLNLEYAYVRLGYLLEWIQDNLLYYDNTKNSNPIFTIYSKEKDNYCLRFPTQISSNPKICIIPSTVTCEDIKSINFEDGNIGWDILPELQAKAQYIIKDEPNKGNLMNIFVNIDYTAKCIADNTDSNGKTNLFKFLTSLLNSINDSLGNVNKLEPVFDAEVNQLKIIEGSGLNNKPNSEIAIFQTFGIGTENIPKGSFITNVDFQVQLPPNMAAMATISAQAKGNIVGENATGLSKLNTGFTDRVITTKFTKDMIEGGNEEKNTKTIFEKNLKQISILAKNIYSDKIYSIDNIEVFKSINRDVSLYVTGEEAIKNIAPAPFFIPFNLSLTMTGLSGMVNYERFAVTEDILPYSYRSGDQGGVIDFLIKGISHSIKDNKWTTKIESLSVSSIRKKK